MQFSLDNMTIKSDKVLSHLCGYLDKVSTYNGFDPSMAIKVFVAPDGDFIGFEACEYMLGFVSYAHKLSEVRHTAEQSTIVQFQRFRHKVNQLALTR